MFSSRNRRRFLGGSLGAAVGALFAKPNWSYGSTAEAELQPAGGHEARLRESKITLPPPPSPVANYVPAVQVGNILYVSGTGSRRPDGTFIQGKVGKDLTKEEAYDAARIAGLRVLSTVRNTLGSLDRVVRVVKVLGMVNAVPEFEEQPAVVNGFSDLMVEIFGEEAGKAARSAVGMGSLPFNIPIEVESIFEVT